MTDRPALPPELLASIAARIMAAERSPLGELVADLVDRYGDGAEAALDVLFERVGILEAAAALYDWEGVWARSKQLPPSGDDWSSFGILTGRGFGKTLSISHLVQREVHEGRARHIALIAQNEDMTKQIMVDGPSGLLATSPPWFRARIEKGVVVWPNGARAFLYTPEVPGELRGPEHDLAWATEFVAWPAATRDEAYLNLTMGLRRGRGRLLWDTTPKKRDPLIKKRLAAHDRDPKRHVVVRGSTFENAANLAPAQLREWLEEYAGTQKGDEELEGRFTDESDRALWRQEWIDRSRRRRPAQFVRRVIAIDPAITSDTQNDVTGIGLAGTTADEQLHILEDWSDHHEWRAWGDLAVSQYVANECDCIVIERNRGGDACAANIKTAAEAVGLTVTIVPLRTPTRWHPSTIYVKEVLAADSKGTRAEPVAALAERGRISHCEDSDLSELENEMTTWEPDGKHPSPNRIDWAVHAAWELAKLGDAPKDHRRSMSGLTDAAARLEQAARAPVPTSPSAVATSGRRRFGRGGDGWGNAL